MKKREVSSTFRLKGRKSLVEFRDSKEFGVARARKCVGR